MWNPLGSLPLSNAGALSPFTPAATVPPITNPGVRVGRGVRIGRGAPEDVHGVRPPREYGVHGPAAYQGAFGPDHFNDWASALTAFDAARPVGSGAALRGPYHGSAFQDLMDAWRIQRPLNSMWG